MEAIDSQLEQLRFESNERSNHANECVDFNEEIIKLWKTSRNAELLIEKIRKPLQESQKKTEMNRSTLWERTKEKTSRIEELRVFDQKIQQLWAEIVVQIQAKQEPTVQPTRAMRGFNGL
jgi:chromosome segregation ATPase